MEKPTTPPPPPPAPPPGSALLRRILGKKKKKRLTPAERRKKIRDQFWPNSEKLIWHRLENDGFITIPKLLSLVCALIKRIGKNDPSSVYLDLWCRSFDEGIIEAVDEDEAAYSSGYEGSRASRTWSDHIWDLEKLGFIKVQPHGNHEIGHVLIVNPLVVVESIRNAGRIKLPERWWGAYVTRADKVGAVLPSDKIEDTD